MKPVPSIMDFTGFAPFIFLTWLATPRASVPAQREVLYG